MFQRTPIICTSFRSICTSLSLCWLENIIGVASCDFACIHWISDLWHLIVQNSVGILLSSVTCRSTKYVHDSPHGFQHIHCPGLWHYFSSCLIGILYRVSGKAGFLFLDEVIINDNDLSMINQVQHKVIITASQHHNICNLIISHLVMLYRAATLSLMNENVT